MKTLQEIKDEYAQECGREDFEDLLWLYADSEDGIEEITFAFEEVAKRYAQQVGEQVRKDAAERAEVENCYGDYIVDKQSILETEIKLP